MEKSTTCTVDECERGIHVKTRGLCSMHYQRLMRHGSTADTVKPIKTCKVDGCGRELTGSIGQGMCSKHYQRWRKNGTTDALVEQWWHDERADNPDRCTMDGCTKPQKTGGLCSMHDSRKRRGLAAATCEWCWDAFNPRRRNQKFCTDYCANAAKLVRSRAYTRQWLVDNPRPRVETRTCRCVFCHQEFEGTRRRFMYCSPYCWATHRARGGDPYSTRRRQRERDATVEKFSKREIFERDGWICWLCEEPIDRDAVFPDGLSASLDHVIPLARGGEHSRSNTKCAHLRCNCKKNARIVTS